MALTVNKDSQDIPVASEAQLCLPIAQFQEAQGTWPLNVNFIGLELMKSGAMYCTFSPTTHP